MRTIIWFFRTLTYLIAAIPDARRIKKLQKKGDYTAADKMIDIRVRHWALSMLITAGTTVDVIGRENIPPSYGQNVLFVPNHQSDWDIPILLSYGPLCGIMAKKGIAKIPIIKSYMDFFHCRFIDRSNPRSAIKAIKEVGDILAGGESFMIFAEGTRSKGEELGEFHNHSLMTAARNGIDIVPISIDGSYKIMEANRGFFIRPAHVILTFLPPIHTDTMDRREYKNLGRIVREAIAAGRENSRALIEGSVPADTKQIPS